MNSLGPWPGQVGGGWHGEQPQGPWGLWVLRASSLGFAVFPGSGNCSESWDFVPSSLRHFYYLNGQLGCFQGGAPFVAFLSQDVVCSRFRQTVCLCFPSLVHMQEAFRTRGSNELEQLPKWACFHFSLMTFIVLIAVFRGQRVYMLIIRHLKNVEKEYRRSVALVRELL